MIVQLSQPTLHRRCAQFGLAPPAIAARERGSLLAFPVWVPHRLSPVTSGKRYVVTCSARPAISLKVAGVARIPTILRLEEKQAVPYQSTQQHFLRAQTEVARQRLPTGKASRRQR